MLLFDQFRIPNFPNFRLIFKKKKAKIGPVIFKAKYEPKMLSLKLLKYAGFNGEMFYD